MFKFLSNADLNDDLKKTLTPTDEIKKSYAQAEGYSDWTNGIITMALLKGTRGRK